MLATSNRLQSFSGTGTTGPFPYTFMIFDEGDLLVTHIDPTGASNELTLGVDYTVTGVRQRNGGTVTLTAPLLVGWTLIIERIVAETQPVSFRTQNKFDAARHEDAYDRLTMMAQQHGDDLERAIKIPKLSSADVTFPDPDANKVIGWDSSGTKLTNSSPTAGPPGPQGPAGVGGPVPIFANDAARDAFYPVPAADNMAWNKGRGWVQRRNTGNTRWTNEGLTRGAGPIMSSMSEGGGAVGDGATDDSAAVTNMSNFSLVSGIAQWDPTPTGAAYLISNNVTLDGHHQFNQGAKLKIANGKTVTIAKTCLIEAEHQIWDESLGGKVVYTQPRMPVRFEWHGAKFDSTADDGPAFQRAFNAAPDGTNFYIPPFKRARVATTIHLMQRADLSVFTRTFGRVISTASIFWDGAYGGRVFERNRCINITWDGISIECFPVGGYQAFDAAITAGTTVLSFTNSTPFAFDTTGTLAGRGGVVLMAGFDDGIYKAPLTFRFVNKLSDSSATIDTAALTSVGVGTTAGPARFYMVAQGATPSTGFPGFTGLDDGGLSTDGGVVPLGVGGKSKFSVDVTSGKSRIYSVFRQHPLHYHGQRNICYPDMVGRGIRVRGALANGTDLSTNVGGNIHLVQTTTGKFANSQVGDPISIDTGAGMWETTIASFISSTQVTLTDAYPLGTATNRPYYVDLVTTIAAYSDGICIIMNANATDSIDNTLAFILPAVGLTTGNATISSENKVFRCAINSQQSHSRMEFWRISADSDENAEFFKSEDLHVRGGDNGMASPFTGVSVTAGSTDATSSSGWGYPNPIGHEIEIEGAGAFGADLVVTNNSKDVTTTTGKFTQKMADRRAVIGIGTPGSVLFYSTIRTFISSTHVQLADPYPAGNGTTSYSVEHGVHRTIVANYNSGTGHATLLDPALTTVVAAYTAVGRCEGIGIYTGPSANCHGHMFKRTTYGAMGVIIYSDNGGWDVDGMLGAECEVMFFIAGTTRQITIYNAITEGSCCCIEGGTGNNTIRLHAPDCGGMFTRPGGAMVRSNGNYILECCGWGTSNFDGVNRKIYDHSNHSSGFWEEIGTKFSAGPWTMAQLGYRTLDNSADISMYLLRDLQGTIDVPGKVTAYGVGNSPFAGISTGMAPAVLGEAHSDSNSDPFIGVYGKVCSRRDQFDVSQSDVNQAAGVKGAISIDRGPIQQPTAAVQAQIRWESSASLSGPGSTTKAYSLFHAMPGAYIPGQPTIPRINGLRLEAQWVDNTHTPDVRGVWQEGVNEPNLLSGLTSFGSGRVEKGTVYIDIAAAGNATPNAAGAEQYRYRLAGAATVNNPLGLVKGMVFKLIMFNNSGAGVTPTLGSKFLGSGFGSIGAGFSRARMYAYDDVRDKLEPLGPVTEDF